MKYVKKISLLIAVCVFLLCGCGEDKNSENADKTNTDTANETGTETDMADGNGEAENEADTPEAFIYVEGYSLGPGVSKLILKFDSEINSVEAENAKIKTAGIERKVTDVYLCDADGSKTGDASGCVAFELTDEHMMECSPFTQGERSRVWTDSYPVEISIPEFKAGDKTYPLQLETDCISNRICPDAELFSYRSSYTGTYKNPLTEKQEELTLQMAAYEPETLKDGEKNPLLIWLHGASEGGTDPDVTILGNKVSALAKEGIQSAFKAGNETGAYILAVQCDTYWMDEGDGTNGAGSGDSRYTQALMDTISDYLKHNEDVDTDRIYLAGCSNGGYMTMNMIISYPDFFAAAVPVCEAYSFYVLERDDEDKYVFSQGNPYQRDDGVWTIEYDAPKGRQVGAMGSLITDDIWMTEDKIQKIADMPIWFVASADDPIVSVNYYMLPTYKALKQEGSENCWVSLFETYGHSAWVPFLDNQVTGVQDEEQLLASEKDFQTAPADEGGGVLQAAEYGSVFEWLNAQKKGD